jgi:hypothetical protein
LIGYVDSYFMSKFIFSRATRQGRIYTLMNREYESIYLVKNPYNEYVLLQSNQCRSPTQEKERQRRVMNSYNLLFIISLLQQINFNVRIFFFNFSIVFDMKKLSDNRPNLSISQIFKPCSSCGVTQYLFTNTQK